MQTLAAVMDEQGRPAPFALTRPFAIEEITLDGPGPGEVLVEIVAAGLCHSDLTTVEGLRARPLPIIGGHEGAGIVRDVGPGVTALRADDYVVLTAASGCGCCPSCTGGRPVLCETVRRIRLEGALATGARRFRRHGTPINHYSGVSSFSRYTVVTVESAVRIDPTHPLDIAAVFGCAVLTGAGAIFNSARLSPGQTVAVIGLGGVGLNAVMAAKAAGAGFILGIDLDPDRAALARDLGCDAFLAAGCHDLLTQALDLTHGGTDVAVEVSGSQPGIDTALAVTRRGGEVICVGLARYGTRYAYPHGVLVGEEKALRGSLLGSGDAQRDIPAYLALHASGRLPVDRLISDRIPLAGLNTALDRLKTGQALRQLILPGLV